MFLPLPSDTPTHTMIVFVSGSAFSIHIKKHREIEMLKESLTRRVFSVQITTVGIESTWDEMIKRWD